MNELKFVFIEISFISCGYSGKLFLWNSLVLSYLVHKSRIYTTPFMEKG